MVHALLCKEFPRSTSMVRVSTCSGWKWNESGMRGMGEMGQYDTCIYIKSLCFRRSFQLSEFSHSKQISSATQYFWYRETLDISTDINHPRNFNLQIGAALFVAWILVYLCLAKGLASSPKVIFKTSTCWLLSPRKTNIESNVYCHCHAKEITFICFQLVYVTALFPYCVLILFFCRGVSLEGMQDGIIHLFSPKVRIVTENNPTTKQRNEKLVYCY